MCLREALCILLVEACIFVVLSDGARVTDLSGCSVYVRVVHGTRVRFYVKDGDLTRHCAVVQCPRFPRGSSHSS
jgi:hypothetical protein